MAALSASLTAVAYRSANGELAWRRSDLPAALSAIAASDQAILGGEVWVALGGGFWQGWVPGRHGESEGVWPWNTSPRKAGEGWKAYCLRTAEESERAVAGMRVEEESDPAVHDRLYFNVTYTPESDSA